MSPLGFFNFVLAQWFCVRLGRAHLSDGRVRWAALRWVWPLTGWWSDYRWIKRTWPAPRPQ